MDANNLTDLIENSILNQLAQLHTITIAKIVKVESKTIDVKPIFKRRIKDVEIEYPIFTKVPPIFLNGGSSYISFPLSVGDYCLLLVNERCYDNWYEGLDNKSPLEYRMFDYSDSFALVGIQPKSKAISIPSVTTQIGDTYAEGNYTQVGNYTRQGNMVMTGNFTLNGTLTVTGDIILNGTSLQSFVTTHTHTEQGDGQETSTPNY